MWFRRRAKNAAGINGAPHPAIAAVLSDVGCHREINEDRSCLIEPSDPAQLEAKGILAVVADGMGGHQSGEIASGTAIESISRDYYASGQEPGSALRSAVERANQAIWKRAQEQAGFRGMGTTCTALALCGGQAYAAHVGDSRLYMIRAGNIYQMTEDHSAVAQMVRQGLLTVEEAHRHEDRNVVLRALGTTPKVEVDTWGEPLPVRDGDVFVLCSDGLHDLVAAEEIRDVSSAQTPERACQALVRSARERGGFDNITVAIVAYRSTAELARPAARETRESEITI